MNVVKSQSYLLCYLPVFCELLKVLIVSIEFFKKLVSNNSF
jgi:hypothetical protein